jgi:transglutaminase/protease-like cytokinesis protein 3
MKFLLSLLVLITVSYAFAQPNTVSFSRIDWNAQSIDADNIDTLAERLTAPYISEKEKVRSIFSWITQHIAYNVGIFNYSRRLNPVVYNSFPEDTASVWRSADEMTAQRVLRRRVAVCDGYAKLFKTLCDYAGIQSVVVTGYAKGYLGGGDRFRSNHSWNAVRVDSTWQLVDVTWASGFVTMGNEFVQRLDESYFFTKPEQFIQDHYPEDLRWTLLEHPPAMREFDRAPFKCKSFVKYGISSFFPGKGIIDAALGDTVRIELQFKDATRNKTISSDPFFDSTMLSSDSTRSYISPDTTIKGNTMIYNYVVQEPRVEWIDVLYNDDVVMRYRLHIRKNENWQLTADSKKD